MAAAVRGHKECVSLLLEYKADVNAQNVDGHTALMFAYNGKNQVETLLDKYADYIKDVDSNSTKIIKDALQTHVDVIDMLVTGGANKDIKDNEGHVALDFDYKPLPPIEETIPGSITKDKDEL
jgi:ankyrin repeat protein